MTPGDAGPLVAARPPRPIRVAFSIAALLAAAPAAGYVRTTDPGTGKALAWPTPVIPYQVNPARAGTSPSCAATSSHDPALDAARASVGAWQQSCANLTLVYGGTTQEIGTGLRTENDHDIVFRHGWCSQDPNAKHDPCLTDPDVDCGSIYGCFDDGCAADATTCSDWNIVALTSVLYDPGSGRILDADIEVNDWDGAGAGAAIGNPPSHGWYFTCADTVPGQTPRICTSYGESGCLFIDLRNTLTHEAGHFVGLAHAPDPNATMYATTRPADEAKRSLSADDVAGVCAIYPEGSSGGGGGCGSAGGGGILALLAAGLALLRRPLAAALTTR